MYELPQNCHTSVACERFCLEFRSIYRSLVKQVISAHIRLLRTVGDVSTCKTPWVDIDSIPGGATWGPFFWFEGWPCFEGLGPFKHRGHLGSRCYVSVYVYICLRLPTWNVNHGTKKEHKNIVCFLQEALGGYLCSLDGQFIRLTTWTWWILHIADNLMGEVCTADAVQHSPPDRSEVKPS